MRILSLDSATECATCSIIDEERVLGEICYNYKKQHSVVLMPMINELLKNTGTKIDDIDGYVVSKGPGSFTGLRIGMAAIKGLSHGTNKPFISISSLDALANNFSTFSGIVCPILDALRNNVYCSLYKFENNKLVALTEHLTLSIDELISIVQDKNESVLFVGDAVPKFKSLLSENIPGSIFAPSHLNYVRAASLGQLGMDYLKDNKSDDLYTCAPIYLRKSQAEREYEEKQMRAKNE